MLKIVSAPSYRLEDNLCFILHLFFIFVGVHTPQRRQYEKWFSFCWKPLVLLLLCVRSVFYSALIVPHTQSQWKLRPNEESNNTARQYRTIKACKCRFTSMHVLYMLLFRSKRFLSTIINVQPIYANYSHEILTVCLSILNAMTLRTLIALSLNRKSK